MTEETIESLKKAVESLVRALEQPINEFTRDSVIQRFEYSYEECWKAMQKILITEFDIEAQKLVKKQLFREAGKRGLIDDVEQWFKYHDARNQTAHVYNEEKAKEVYNIAKEFPKSAEYLIKTLSEIIQNDKT